MEIKTGKYMNFMRGFRHRQAYRNIGRVRCLQAR